MYDAERESLKRRAELKRYLDKILAPIPLNDKEAVIAVLSAKEAVDVMLGILMDGEWKASSAEVEDIPAGRYAVPGVRLSISAIETDGTAHSFDVLWTANDAQPVPVQHIQFNKAL